MLSSAMDDVIAYVETAQILARQLREAVIDYPALEQKIRPCELSRCRATCCHDGVYLSREEANGIDSLLTKHPELIQQIKHYGGREVLQNLPGKKCQKTATRLATPNELAVDYPAHFPKTRCVFLDHQGRCLIQMFSVDQGRDPWYDKPLTCWIHPLVILPESRDRPRPVLTLVHPENDPQKAEGYPGFASCTHCGRPDETGSPAYEVLQEELAMLGKISGRDILGELCAQEV